MDNTDRQEHVWLSVPEVAEKRKVSDQAVYQAIERGALKAESFRHGQRRYFKVRADWAEEWTVGAAGKRKRGKQQSDGIKENIGRRGVVPVAA